MDSSKCLLTILQFCDRYNVGRTTVFAEMNKQRLKAVKIGSKTMIPLDAAEEWLRALPPRRRQRREAA